MRHLIFVVIALGCAACAASTKQPEHVTLPDRFAVHCSSLVDGVAATPRPNAVVIVEHGRVAAIADAAPPDLPLIDLEGFTVLPGLIDMHVHLTDSPTYSGNLKLVLERNAQGAFADARANAEATLRAGFTTVRDVGSYRAWTVRDVRDAIRRGDFVGPRIQTAGPYLTIPGGGGDMNIPGVPLATIAPLFRVGVSRGPEQFRAHAQAIVAEHADVLKVIASGAVLAMGGVPGEPEMSEDEIRAVAEVAHAAGLKLAAHAHGARSILEAIRAGADTIEHATYLDDAGIAEAKQRGVAFSMDVYDGDYIDTEGRKQGWPAEYLQKNADTMEIQRRAFSHAAQSGATLVYGTDAAVYPHGDNAKQFAIMVRLGMSPMQAIQSATSAAARAMGLDQDVGSLVPGHAADLVAVRGDPLDDVKRLENVEFVMLGGQIVRDTATRSGVGR